MSEIESFSLKDLINKTLSRTISLPTVQRGFVWKPSQIENLWDSLLRGYPIGSFVLSKVESDGSKKFELLDGQQRASAICLGFYNPLDENSISNNKVFKTSNENINIFIDLVKPNSVNDNRKYLFRVITKSHPWGYRRQENQKTLESSIIAKAMSFYNIQDYDYINKPLKMFWPFDSFRPIPIGLFVNADDIEDLKKSILKWELEVNIKNENKWKVIEKRDDEKINYYTIDEIYKDVQVMLKNQKIPLLFLDFKKIIDEDNSIDNSKKTFENIYKYDDNNESDLEENTSEDRKTDEIENLFVRLNSGGTPLRGEELNYSILKSKIDRDFQEKIEDKCKGLFYPARFITIVFRLYNNKSLDDKYDDKDSISMRIKPKQFQKLLVDHKKKKFLNYLSIFLDSDIFIKIKKLLIYNSESNKKGLPTFIAYSLADKAPEVMFMLLYRIYEKRDDLDSNLIPKILGIITLFTWFGRGEKQRDHSKLLQNIWPCVKKFDKNRFWSSEIIQRAVLKDRDYEILTIFPKLIHLNQIISDDIRNLTWTKIIEESPYGNFIYKAFYNKELILYAQRRAISEWFKDIEDYDLEDTNRAFDWDHVCPSSYIHNKRDVPRALKDWYNSNGNFRALPFSLNRSDQDDSPANKLNPKSDSDLSFWCSYLKDSKLSEYKLKKYLLTKSFCDKDWLDIDENIRSKIKENTYAKQVINCILKRNINICKEWYDQLEINELLFEDRSVKSKVTLFDNLINKTKWSGVKIDDDTYEYCLPLKYQNLFIYFSFNISENTLKENETQFGIKDENKSGELRKVRVPKKRKDDYIVQADTDYEYVYSWFTLLSDSEKSRIDLFKEFYKWLDCFPDTKIKKITLKKFKDSIKTNYQNIFYN